MREIEEIEEQIKRNWFPEHKAKLTEHEGISIIDWKKDGTSIYGVRYIFAGSRLYVSGDIGDAIFHLTWLATPQSFKGVNLGYLLGKLTCHSRNRWHFDERKAKNDLREWYEEVTAEENGEKYLKEAKEIHNALKKIIASVSSPEELERELFGYYVDNPFYYFDAEDFSMFSKFGRKLPHVFVAYLLGIKLALEQLEKVPELLEGK
jgi:hypothetical protein